MKSKGFALMWFSSILSMGSILNADFAWMIGVALGLIGLVMVFFSKEK